MMKRIALGFLRLLIGVGFTFSLVLGATLTMLALFHGPGDNLVLNRPGPDWGWGGGAAAAWALTLFWRICWRCLPAVKPAGLFAPLERSVQKPAFLANIIIPILATLSGCYFMLGEWLKLLVHAAGASWLHFLWGSLVALINGSAAFSRWKQWRRERQTRIFTEKFYGEGQSYQKL